MINEEAFSSLLEDMPLKLVREMAKSAKIDGALGKNKAELIKQLSKKLSGSSNHTEEITEISK